MLLIIEILLTVAVCKRLSKAGKGWGWGLLPGVIVIGTAFLLGLNAAQMGLTSSGLTGMTLMLDLLLIVILIIMYYVFKPVASPPAQPKPPINPPPQAG